jgi:protein SCO1
MRRNLFIVILAGFFLGALVALVLFINEPSGPGVVETSGTALIGGPFALTDPSGKTVTDRDFHDRYKLVFFGFTHCPDICPAELQVMAAALEALGEKADKVVPIFISLDPERDTPQVMGDYVKNFGPRFVGLTGSADAVAAAAKAYRVVYSKVDDQQSANGYTVDHSAIVYLMSPEGGYLTHFAYGTSAETMAQALRRYL